MLKYLSVFTVLFSFSIINATYVSADSQTIDQSLCTKKKKKGLFDSLSKATPVLDKFKFGKKSDDTKELAESIVATGIVLGTILSDQLDKCDQKLVDEANKKAIETGKPQSWANSNTGNSGRAVVETSQNSSRSGNVKFPSSKKQPPCITNYVSIDNGEEIPQKVCKGADGTWRPA